MKADYYRFEKAFRPEGKPRSYTGTYFVKDLGASSIQSIELVAAFEEEFDIEMDEEEALDVKTVGSAVTFIQKVLDKQ